MCNDAYPPHLCESRYSVRGLCQVQSLIPHILDVWVYLLWRSWLQSPRQMRPNCWALSPEPPKAMAAMSWAQRTCQTWTEFFQCSPSTWFPTSTIRYSHVLPPCSWLKLGPKICTSVGGCFVDFSTKPKHGAHPEAELSALWPLHGVVGGRCDHFRADCPAPYRRRNVRRLWPPWMWCEGNWWRNHKNPFWISGTVLESTRKTTGGIRPPAFGVSMWYSRSLGHFGGRDLHGLIHSHWCFVWRMGRALHALFLPRSLLGG